jgi:hypothetical protein
MSFRSAFLFSSVARHGKHSLHTTHLRSPSSFLLQKVQTWSAISPSRNDFLRLSRILDNAAFLSGPLGPINREYYGV